MKKAFSFLITVLLLAGCAMKIHTTGYADRTGGDPVLPPGASIAVLSNDPAPNPILDGEIKGKIETLLLRQRFRLAAPERADYHLAFGYSIQPGLRSGTATTFSPPQTHIRRVPDGRGGVTTQAITIPGASTSVPVVTPEYTRQVSLKVTAAARAREGREEKVLWIGESSSLDPSSDLRSAIDYLLVATFLHFGRDTGRELQVRIGKDHPDLQALRGKAAP